MTKGDIIQIEIDPDAMDQVNGDFYDWIWSRGILMVSYLQLAVALEKTLNMVE